MDRPLEQKNDILNIGHIGGTYIEPTQEAVQHQPVAAKGVPIDGTSERTERLKVLGFERIQELAADVYSELEEEKPSILEEEFKKRLAAKIEGEASVIGTSVPEKAKILDTSTSIVDKPGTVRQASNIRTSFTATS